MQNAGQQFGQGGAPSHQNAPFGHTESTTAGGSITSSLRQFRRKNEDKQNLHDTPTSVAESHVARVPPHNHYPARQTAECYRYPQQYQDYSLPTQPKFSEISDPNQSLQEHISASVIQKTKDKEFMEMCNIQQPHIKQQYDHMNGQQAYPDSNIHPHAPHAQYIHKDGQVHPAYKPESQYFPKDPQYQPQLPQQIQKYNMPTQIRKFPPGNDFLSKLRRIHPTMARSIMSDHHLQESQTPYQQVDQSRMYPPSQNQRYMNYPTMQNNPYQHGYMTSQGYSNYPASCNYARSPQMAPRFPSINPHERSLSPRRGYQDNMAMSMNYGVMPPQKIPSNYHQYSGPEYAQHYQHRRAPVGQDYYQQQCRPTQYLPHQMPPQDMPESRVTVSDSIKQYIENWADEETASEMSQLENSMLGKEGMRVRDDQGTETVYMINASEIQYFENGIPLVTSESTIPMVASENCQYVIKSGVAIDNASGMVRIIDNKNDRMTHVDSSGEHVVNLHIMDPLKQDCMLANKPNDSNQRQTNENIYGATEKPRVLVHQNTVIQSGYQDQSRDTAYGEVTEEQVKIGNSLPIINDTLEEFDRNIKECKKITVDKNCSPITLDQLEEYREESSVICSNKDVIGAQDAKTSDDPVQNISVSDVFSETTSKSDIGNGVKLVEDTSKIEDGDQVNSAVSEMNSHTSSELPEEKEKSDTGEKEKQDIKEEEARAPHQQQSHDPLPSDDQPVVPVNDAVIDESVDIPTSAAETIKSASETTTSDAETNTSVVDTQASPDETTTSAIETNDSFVDSVTSAMDRNKEKDETDEPDVTMSSDNIETRTTIAGDSKIDCNLAAKLISPINNSKTNEKSTNKRSRRIFSVDDIINNIGRNVKSKCENDALTRRHSLQSTKEFLDKEISNIFKISVGTDSSSDGFVKEVNEEELPLKENEACQVKENKDDLVKKMSEKDDENKLEESEDKMITEKRCEETDIIDELLESEQSTEKAMEIDRIVEKSSETVIEEEKLLVVEAKETVITEPDQLLNEGTEILNEGKTVLEITDETVITDSIIQHDSNDLQQEPVEGNVGEEIQSTKEFQNNDSDILNENTIDRALESIDERMNDNVSDQNEIQYRSVIKVEESSVLLQIAGELVEINVNSVNGKKIITVVPLSDTTVSDINDNYETEVDPESADPSQIDQVMSESNDNIDEGVDYQVPEPEPEPDIVETTSEVIIGMDLSLEEEIKLDIAQPNPPCTKAAKKSYDSDLQIPSITTSEDVYDKNKTEAYSSNDKVSSSKEHSTKNKKPSGVGSSRRLEHSKRLVKKTDEKSPFAEINKAKDKHTEDEEFVPFRDLIKARKLKKLKLQEIKNSEYGKVDSTMRIDEMSRENIDSTDISKGVELMPNKDESEETVSTKNEAKRKLIASDQENVGSKKTKEDVSDPKSENKIADVPVDKNWEKKEPTINLSNCPSEDPVKNKESKHVKLNSRETGVKEVRNYKLEDPRLKHKYPEAKKKLSLEEYNKRKRKLQTIDRIREHTKTDKISAETPHLKFEESSSFSARIKSTKPEKNQFHRPKSLDDLNSLKPKENKCVQRKLSLQSSPVKQNNFDWEETQSPKTNLVQDARDKRFSEFSGLIHNNTTDKSEKIIDNNHLNVESSHEFLEDEILQNYKEQVDFKLSSLKFEIPRVSKPLANPFSKSESSGLMQRFLKNDKLTSEEMDKIRKIISYKRLMQQLKKPKPPESPSPKSNPTYEIHKEFGDRDTKLHLKKVADKKQRSRFRNVCSPSNSKSEEISDKKMSDYSVVQSNCLAGVVPKLIIKRKTEMPLPVVRLERLDLGLLDNKRIRYIV